jgi:hypothetical protein
MKEVLANFTIVEVLASFIPDLFLCELNQFYLYHLKKTKCVVLFLPDQENLV